MILSMVVPMVLFHLLNCFMIVPGIDMSSIPDNHPATDT